jgi:tRNA modification GTPase
MFYSPDEQTIIAQCTPRASGAIGLLRISGSTAIAIADAISSLASGKKLAQLPSHTIHYGSVLRQSQDDRVYPFVLSPSKHQETATVDNVLFLLMRAPKTFTGQDTVEITCHNNQFIIEEIIALAIGAGARLAQEGEFTKRAVLSGKIDLIQAEAINELIHAQTQLALKQSLAQLDGSFSHWLQMLEKDLLKGLALCQASFEFLDEEMEFAPQISALILTTQNNINTIKKTFNQQQTIRQGIRIAIIGSVNAGKSSLFNALLNQNRAIVNAQAGTTRDSIEAGLYKNGNYWTLVDTAGLRQTDDTIEQEGIKRSFEEAHKADIIILAYDGSREINAQEKAVYAGIVEKYPNKIITVFTKADETQSKEPFVVSVNEISVSNHVVENPIFLSSKTKINIDLLEKQIEQKITGLFAQIESPFLLNQRHYNILLTLENKLLEIQQMLAHKTVAYELLSVHINDAIANLAELSGKAISEAGMDMVFREFCIGK